MHKLPAALLCAFAGMPLVALCAAAAPASVTSIAALKALDPASMASRHVSVQGYYPGASVGGGIYDWKPNCPGPVDDGLYVSPAGGGAGCYVLKHAGSIDVTQFGADPTGHSEAAPAFERAFLSAFTHKIGLVTAPRGTFLFSTATAHSNSVLGAFVVMRDGVSFQGAGERATILKLADHVVTTTGTQDAPCFFCTAQPGPLSNANFSDFTIDFNGAKNQTDKDHKRHVNGFYTSHGASNLRIRNVAFLTNPGRQDILIQNGAYARTPGGPVIVENTRHINPGGCISNGTNDHSSLYIMADYTTVKNNSFICDTYPGLQVTAYELHGAHNIAVGNSGRNFYQSWFISNDGFATTDTIVMGDRFTNLKRAGQFAASFSVGTVTIADSQYAQIERAGPVSFFNQTPPTLSDSLTVSNVTFSGGGIATGNALNVSGFRSVKIVNNRFSAFSVTGIVATDAYPQNVSIGHNRFYNVVHPVDFNNAASSFAAMDIDDNQMTGNATTGASGIRIQTAGGALDMANNPADENYAPTSIAGATSAGASAHSRAIASYGHFLPASGKPTMSSGGVIAQCAGTCTDAVGHYILAGAGNALSLTFLKPWPAAPVCFFQDEARNVTLQSTRASSTSVAVLASNAMAAGSSIFYQCGVGAPK